MNELKNKILEIFKQAGKVKSPEAEADQILFHVFRKAIPSVQSFSDLQLESSVFALDPITATAIELEAIQIARSRVAGAPLQHLLGYQYFFEHEYQVSPSVLIPRPETEILISAVIEACNSRFQNRPCIFAELGLGSGILSSEILAHFSSSRGFASEASAAAAALARKNLTSVLGTEWSSRLQILVPEDPSVGFEIFKNDEKFDLILSNPPYVSRRDEIEKEVLDFEPHLALFPAGNHSQENPDYFYENFIKNADLLLNQNGIAFFEVPHERAETLMRKFVAAGFVTETIVDLNQRPRVLKLSR